MTPLEYDRMLRRASISPLLIEAAIELSPRRELDGTPDAELVDLASMYVVARGEWAKEEAN